MATRLMCGPRDADTPVRDVLVWARVQTRSAERKRFHELTGHSRRDWLLQRHVQVPAPARGVILHVGEPGGREQGPELGSVVVHDDFAGLGRIQVQTECSHGAVNVMDHHSGRGARQGTGDPRRGARPRIAKVRAIPSPNPVVRLARDQGSKDPGSASGRIFPARRGTNGWRGIKHSVYTFGRGYDLKRTHSVEFFTGDLGGTTV